MIKFELRVSDENDIWGDWMPVNDPDSVAANIFGPQARHVRAVRYEYINGSCIEYRRARGK